jgi:hypothetical protein
MPKPLRQITIHDFLTEDEIHRAQAIYAAHRKAGTPANFSKAVRDELIAPNMARINRALGQENDAHYLAYAVEYVLGEAWRVRPW